MTTLADIQTAMNNAMARTTSGNSKNAASVVNHYEWNSSWENQAGWPGGAAADRTTPTTAVALDYTGSLGKHSVYHPAPAVGTVHLVEAIIARDLSPYEDHPNYSLLIDRLSHTGGLDGTVTTAQTTNLPTAALTRYADGEGVLAALTYYDATGTTNHSITCSYTNSAGVAGRTGTLPLIDATPATGFFGTFGLEGADTGVRSVESVTWSVSSGTAGDVGVVLYKPLVTIPDGKYHDITTLVGWPNPILEEAHLEVLTSGFGFNGELYTPFLQLGFAELV